MAWRNRSRRCYEINVRDEDVMTLLGNWRMCQGVALPIMDEAIDCQTGRKFDIPKDYEIVGCAYSEFERWYRIIISHPSFPEVPDGALTPRLSLMHVVVRCLPFKTGEPEPTIEAKGIDDEPRFVPADR